MKTTIVLFILSALSLQHLNAQAQQFDKTPSATLPKNYGFIENKGQLVDQHYKPNSNVKYLLCRPGFNVQLRQTGFSYDTYSDTKDSSKHKEIFPSKHKFIQPDNFTRHYHRVDVELLNCNSHAEIVTSGTSKTYFNYFTAGTPDGGVSYVHYYERVVYKNIYPNIDLEFFVSPDKNSGAEYNFILHPGADANDIKLAYKGMSAISLKENALKVKVSAGTFSETIPASYFKQTGVSVNVNYSALGNNTFTFLLPKNISITSDLIIDPRTICLDWGTYYGGTDVDYSGAIALDSTNDVFIAGSTKSTSNIATSGAYQVSYAGGLYDAFIAKFDSSGTSLIWGTYYGGTGIDGIDGIKLDKRNYIYVAGRTASSTNIATPGSYQSSYLGGINGNSFVAKFNSSGTSLIWGTYYGGLGPDYLCNIALDTTDNIYITGYTYSQTNIATPGAYQTTFGGNVDAFVAKFDSSGSNLLWGTYYGGPYSDYGWGITVDALNNVYITGYTESLTKIATSGAYQTTFGGGTYDAFVAKFNSIGTSLIWGTYYGGTGSDEGIDLYVDNLYDVYATGGTNSATNIATPGAYKTNLTATGNNQNVYLAKFNSNGSSLLWGTYYGGMGNDGSSGIILDANKFIYITGGTSSNSGIATPGVYQTTYGGGTYDAFVAKFDSAGSSLIWGTYYGGPAEDGGYGITIDSKFNAYITGSTSSNLNITTPGVYQTTYGSGNSDAFVAKFRCNCDLVALNIKPNDTSICIGDSITLIANAIGTKRVKYLWSPGGQTSPVIHIVPTSSITYSITVTDTAVGCMITDTIPITVNAIPTAVIKGNNIICQGNSTTLTASGGTSYLWSTGATTSSINLTPSSTTTYSVSVTQNGCTDSTKSTVVVNPNPVLSVCCDSSILFGQNVQLTSSGGGSYFWNPPAGLNCVNCPNPIATPINTTTYTLTITSDSGCTTYRTITVDIHCGDVFIPDVFSPNGDGQNDLLYVRGDCIKSLDFSVFDRWGNRVFRTNDKNTGWDGTFKGQLMNTGSFSYYLRASMYDGSSIEKHGNVALVR